MPCYSMYDQTMPSMQPAYGSYPGTGAYSPQPALPTLPSGLPTGPSPTPLAPAAVPTAGPPPQTVQSTMFTPGFLKTQIGKRVRVEFLIGTNGPLVDRIGTLLGVGASYILIKPIDSDDVLLCDIYSIKFVTFYR